MWNLKTKEMINWKRFLMAVLCSAALIGASTGLTRFFPNVMLALMVAAFVCGLTLSFYMLLGEISDLYNSWKDKEDGR